METKTKKLLLENYKNMYEAFRINCADKQRIGKLITELEKNLNEGEKDDDMLTEDFFKQVDTQRANQLQLQKQEKKQHKIQLKKRLGKHTTFVVEDEYKMGGDTPHMTDQTNIEVVPIGGGGSDGCFFTLLCLFLFLIATLSG